MTFKNIQKTANKPPMREGNMNFHKGIRQLLLSLLAFGVAFSAPAAQRTITVTGIVVDSATRQPLSQAIIGLLDTTSITIPDLTDPAVVAQLKTMVQTMASSGQIDTTQSASDGKFSYSMKINSYSLVLLCGVTKSGYNFGYSIQFLMPTAKTVKLDTIKLSKIPQISAVSPLQQMVPVQMKPTDMRVFTPSGRLLYSGTAANFNKGTLNFHGITLTVKGKCLIKNTEIAHP
jgi:hypothetical protein